MKNLIEDLGVIRTFISSAKEAIANRISNLNQTADIIGAEKERYEDITPSQLAQKPALRQLIMGAKIDNAIK